MDLLDLTRIESGKKKREFVELDLGLVAKSAIDTMLPLAVQFDVSIILENNLTEPFMADPEEMEIILNNLISNAVKYNKNGGSVVCSLSNTSNDLKIVISDTGYGIDINDIPKLFHEFSRIHNTSTKNVSGSGLGLSIVKRIVDMYKGNIEVQSAINEGSSFIVTLPLKNIVEDIAGI
jgi:signal transduction histidine kinase